MAAKKKSRRTKYAEGVDTATAGEVTRYVPSQIIVDHNRNQRFAPYDSPPEIAQWIGPKCCFTLAEIETRLADHLANGQMQPVEISKSNVGHPHLEFGFLRHSAFLLAEARDLLGQIPGARGRDFAGIKALAVPAAKSQADHAAKARRNHAENAARKELSPVDVAVYFKRQLDALREDGTSMSRPELAAQENCHVDRINRHLRLLSSLRPDELLAVHEGRVPMSQALKAASASGAGTSKGPRGANPGVPHGTARKRLAALEVTEMPETITPRDIMLARLMAGALDPADDSVPGDLRSFVAVLQVAPPKPSKPRKKAAQRPGEKLPDAT